MREEQPGVAVLPSGFLSRSRWYAIWLVTLVGCAERFAPSRDTPAEFYAGATASAPEAGQDKRAPGPPTPPAVPRKIIYNAQVDLVVESMTAPAEAVTRLVKANGGYISETT